MAMPRTYLAKALQAAVLTFLLASIGSADTLPLKADAFFNPGDANPYGGLTTINVGGASGSQGLLQFDLSSLPSGITGANVAWARLRLYLSKVTTPGGVTIFEANAPWSEATVNGTSLIGAISAVQLGIPATTANTYITVDVTNLVRNWVNGSPNNGILIAADPASTLVYFDSKENIQTSRPATLELALTGPAGSIGPPGAAGPSGATGIAGAQGPLGPSGPRGLSGVAGPSGPTGAVGPPGPSGPKGATGVAGVQGSRGPTGPSGPSGIKGAIGASGVAGITGPSGPSGPRGPAGVAGPLGPTGPVGPPGASGPTGATGVLGAQGAVGPTGTIGPAGPSGARGPSGALGPFGAGGPSGPAGLGFTNIDAFDTIPHPAPYTIPNTDAHIWIVLNNISSSASVTLPFASSHAGKLIYVLAQNAGTGFVVQSQGGDHLLLIDCSLGSPTCGAQVTFTLPASAAGVGFFSDGTNWRMLSLVSQATGQVG